jgi:hypothetical protein
MVSAINDQATFDLALRELHRYATIEKPTNKARFGIVFRIVTAEERQSIIYKLQNILGVRNHNESCGRFHVPLGQLHIVDDSMLAHTWNRHANREEESERGQLAITLEDLIRLPQVMQPRNIINFVVECGMPRIVYARDDDEGTLIAVQEICNRGLCAKTMYRKK